MERVEAGDLRVEEELAQTKLMEYTVLLINQVHVYLVIVSGPVV